MWIWMPRVVKQWDVKIMEWHFPKFTFCFSTLSIFCQLSQFSQFSLISLISLNFLSSLNSLPDLLLDHLQGFPWKSPRGSGCWQQGWKAPWWWFVNTWRFQGRGTEEKMAATKYYLQKKKWKVNWHKVNWKGDNWHKKIEKVKKEENESFSGPWVKNAVNVGYRGGS